MLSDQEITIYYIGLLQHRKPLGTNFRLWLQLIHSPVMSWVGKQTNKRVSISSKDFHLMLFERCACIKTKRRSSSIFFPLANFLFIHILSSYKATFGGYLNFRSNFSFYFLKYFCLALIALLLHFLYFRFLFILLH